MDVLVRFYSSNSGIVEVHFLKAVMFGHAFADTVSQAILDLLSDLKLPVSNILSLAADGPNVNKAIKTKLDLAVINAGGKGLVDIGFCNLHVVHNSFRKGLDKYGAKAEDLCIDVFYFFKRSSAQREDYQKIQEDLALEEHVFVRHVQTRWLSLLPAVIRILEQWDRLKKFFSKLDKNEGHRTKEIYSTLISDEARVQFTFLKEIKPLFDEFLLVFQTEGPVIHSLYASLVLLTKKLLRRFMKDSYVHGKTGTDLAGEDMQKSIADVKCHIKDDDIELGEDTRQIIKSLKSPLAKKHCIEGIRSFYVITSTYLIKNQPFRNEFLKALICLHPDHRGHKSGIRYIKNVAQKLPCTEDLSSVADEWKVYMEDTIPDEWYMSSNLPTRIDTYWSKVLQLKAPNGELKYKNLAKVVQCCLSLAHSNADTERSLSVNKRMLTTERMSLSEETINGLRHVKDGVKACGGQPYCVPITRKLISACKNANARYEDYRTKAKDTELKKAAEAKAAEEESKEAERLQNERKEKLKKLSENQKMVDDEEKEAQEKFANANLLLDEAQKRLSQAITAKDFNEISIASGLLDVSQKKLQDCKATLEKCGEKKRKLFSKYAAVGSVSAAKKSKK